MAGVKHTKSLIAPDSGVSDKVYGQDWNAEHTLSDVASQGDLDVVSNAVSVVDAALSARINSVLTSATLGNVNLTSLLDIGEIAEPAAPGADTARIYAVDDLGNTRLQYKLPDGTLVQIARDNIFVCKNTEVSNVTKGQVVFMSGGVGVSGTPEIKLAKADSDTTMPAFGMVLENVISVNAFGRILASGKIESIDTTAASEGDRVFVDPSTAGAFTSVQPTSPNYSQRIGVVIASHPSNGVLALIPAGITSPDLTSAVNVVSNAVSALSDAHTSLVNRVSANSALAGGGSVTSAELVDAVSVETANRVSADNVLSAAINTVSAATASVNTRVTSVLSTDISNLRSVDNVLSAAINVVSNKASALSVDIAAVSARVTSVLSTDISNLRSAVNVVSNSLSVLSTNYTSLVNRVSANSAAGGGSVTSAELDAVSAQAASALSQERSVRSAADAALSSRIDAIPGGGSAPAPNFISNDQSITQSTTSTASADISGLGISVSAGGIYHIHAMLIVNKTTGVTGQMKIGLGFPTMNATRGIIVANTSAIQIGAASINIWGWNGNSANNSNIVSAASAGLLSVPVKLEGVFDVQTGGVVQIRVAAATASGTVKRGSFIRAVKIN